MASIGCNILLSTYTMYRVFKFTILTNLPLKLFNDSVMAVPDSRE